MDIDVGDANSTGFYSFIYFDDIFLFDEEAV